MANQIKPSLVILSSLLIFMAATGNDSYLYTVIVCALTALLGFEKWLEVKNQQVKQMKLKEEFEAIREEFRKELSLSSEKNALQVKEGIDIARAEAHRLTLNGITGGKGVRKQEQIRF